MLLKKYCINEFYLEHFLRSHKNIFIFPPENKTKRVKKLLHLAINKALDSCIVYRKNMDFSYFYFGNCQVYFLLRNCQVYFYLKTLHLKYC